MNNNPTISSYKDLMEEKARLHTLLELQKAAIKKNIEELKDDFKPVTSAFKVIEKFTARNDKSKVVNLALDYGVDIIKSTGILKKISWPLRLIVPFITKNIASHLIANSRNKKLKKITEALP